MVFARSIRSREEILNKVGTSTFSRHGAGSWGAISKVLARDACDGPSPIRKGDEGGERMNQIVAISSAKISLLDDAVLVAVEDAHPDANSRHPFEGEGPS